MKLKKQKKLISKLKDNIGSRFIGKDAVIHNMITALLAGGHVLIEDVPGVGKTTFAKALSRSIDAGFSRIQFTPDTLPTDVTGTSIYDASKAEFRVVKGPIHNEIILADEINRTPPKTQSALLEAMEEHQVTIDGTTFRLPELFMVIATENPVEQIGTYMLPEAELDRFMMKLSIGYPTKEMQIEMAKNAAKIYFSINNCTGNDNCSVNISTLKEDEFFNEKSKTDKLKDSDSINFTNNGYTYNGTGECKES